MTVTSAQTTIPVIKIRKSPIDTINYLFLNKYAFYESSKIIEKDTKIPQACGKDLLFYFLTDTPFVNTRVLERGKKLKVNDTLITMRWYNLKNVGCLDMTCHEADRWKLKMNTRSNIMIAESVFCNKTNIKSLSFRVIKFSMYEIILEDLQVKPLKRRYYFKVKRREK